MTHNRCHAVLMLGICLASSFAAAGASRSEQPLLLFVATDGSDAWSGRLADANGARSDGPFATLARARDEIRRLKKDGVFPDRGVVVFLRGGSYFLREPLALAAGDSGRAGAPVLYAAFPGEEVRLSGGREVPSFAPIKDPAILQQLNPAARSEVVCADLKAMGVADFGPADHGGLELFCGDQPMTLARWPNEGFVRIADIVVRDGHKIHGHAGSKIGKFRYTGDRPARWLHEKDPWLHGYWFWDWSEQRQRIESIDVQSKVIALAPPYHGYGYRKGQWYYAFNMLSELDTPGEWYLDRDSGQLFFWPPAAKSASRAVVSVLPTLVTMDNVSHVSLRGFILEAARGSAVKVTAGTDVEIAQCVIRNVGAGGVSVSGTASGVTGCEIYQTGGTGVALNGGDRKTLTPAKLYALGNHIHHYGRISRMYHPGVSIIGVGNRAANNLIHSAPHMAIFFSGNDHVIELNEIHHVCLESNDAGAIYAGRNWTMRGNVIRHNYLHHITGFENRGCVGVYLDDMFASADIVGNIFFQVTRAAFLGGGRDCTIENNIFVDCRPALHVDARALGWAHGHADGWIKEEHEKGTISGIAYNKPPYSTRYPELIGIMNDQPKAPKGNRIMRNICAGGVWDEIEAKARPYLQFDANLLDADPKFVDRAGLDFRLRPDSPALQLGFKPIPVDAIGLRKEPLVRPAFAELYERAVAREKVAQPENTAHQQ